MKALIIVDPQNDFCEGGPLGVANSNQIFPYLNLLKQNRLFSKVFITRDWHPKNHLSFASIHGLKPFEQTIINGEQQMLWPDHCVQGSHGAEVSQKLILDGSEIYTIKGQIKDEECYSGFGTLNNPSKLEAKLLENNITDVVIVGLALDYCVGLTALDAQKKGFKVTVVQEGTKPVSEKTGKEMYEKMRANRIQIVTVHDIQLMQ